MRKKNQELVNIEMWL